MLVSLAQVAANKATGVDGMPLQSILFLKRRTMVIPSHETWMINVSDYTGNVRLAQKKVDVLLDCVIVGGCTCGNSKPNLVSIL